MLTVAFRLAHRKRSRKVINPSLPSNTCVPWRRRRKDFMTPTNFEQYEGGIEHFLRGVKYCRLCYVTLWSIVSSSSSGRSSTWISTNLFRNALDKTFLPPYSPEGVSSQAHIQKPLPGGFCVAKRRKCECGLTTCWVSGMNNSWLSSSKRFSASRTSEGAKLSSSSTTQYL